MGLLQAACAAILATWIALAVRRFPSAGHLLGRLALLAAASWVAEVSCIRLYGFYQYSPNWYPFVDVMPLAVACIWPVVILSAQEMARHLLGEGASALRTSLLSALLVLVDASFIEPVAVAAGLWSWNAPGLFGVPPVGVLGWSFFAGFALAVEARVPPPWRAPAVLVGAPLLTHAALLAAWWGGMRWINVPLDPWGGVGVAAAASLAFAAWATHRRLRFRVPPVVMLSRVPAALFFGVLLVLHAWGNPPLLAWALAFNPIYLALTRGPGAPPRGPTAPAG